MNPLIQSAASYLGLAPSAPASPAINLAAKLRPASFRKIPFQVDNSEFETGRRVQVHEYPQRDKPYSQDMGRATRRIEFDAFVIGADYVEKANALLGAIEAYGPGTLIHPWFGSLTVNVIGCRVAFDRGLGQARLSLSFVEAGELTFPSAAQSTAALSRVASQNLTIASVNWFAQAVNFVKQINAIIIKGLAIYAKVLAFASNPIFALSSLLGFGTLPGNLTSLGALFASPIDLGWNFASLINLSSLAKSGRSGSAISSTYAGTTSSNNSIISSDSTLIPAVLGLTRMAVDPALSAPSAPAYTTATTATINANTAAILANTRQLLLVQAVGLSSYLQCSVYNDTLQVINELGAALDAEALQVTDDDLYQALMAARSAMFEDLTTRSRDSARLVTLLPDAVFPALALAYDYYEDAGRDLEIVARNKIINPGFVPVESLLFLSR